MRRLRPSVLLPVLAVLAAGCSDEPRSLGPADGHDLPFSP